MPNPETIATTRPCPISSSNRARVVTDRDRHGKELRNVICLDSGLIFVDPLPFADTEDYYRTDYRLDYKGVAEPKSRHIYRAGKGSLNRYRRMQDYLTPGTRLLDAGSSSGEFLYLLGKRGVEPEGIEANEGYAEFSRRELGVTVQGGSISSYRTGKRFDAITLIHVLEHLENPADDIRHLAQFLDEGGVFLIEVPNILFPDMEFRNKWHAGHLYSFTARTLAALFATCGFEAVHCEPFRDGGNLYGVFRKATRPGSATVAPAPAPEDPEESLRTLRRNRLLYFFRPRNLVRNVRRLIETVRENAASRGRSPREILDKLYETVR